MNAITSHTQTFSQPMRHSLIHPMFLIKIIIDWRKLFYLIPIGLLFLSSMAVVYVQTQNRSLFAELEQLQRVQNKLKMNWGELLLEQSAYATQPRIAALAENQLNMYVPKNINLVKVEN